MKTLLIKLIDAIIWELNPELPWTGYRPYICNIIKNTLIRYPEDVRKKLTELVMEDVNAEYNDESIIVTHAFKTNDIDFEQPETSWMYRECQLRISYLTLLKEQIKDGTIDLTESI